jgi:hypothetical protein
MAAEEPLKLKSPKMASDSLLLRWIVVTFVNRL